MTGRLAVVCLAALTATAAAADEAEHITAALTRHLNAHGRHFVAGEARRLAIGDASASGAKDDVREDCPQPMSCFDTSKMTPEEVMAALLLLSAQREQTLLEQQINRMTGRNAQLKQLVSELEKATNDAERARLRSEIDKLNGDSQLDMIQLQSLINRRNQAHDMVADLLNKYQKALDGIVQNMR